MEPSGGPFTEDMEGEGEGARDMGVASWEPSGWVAASCMNQRIFKCFSRGGLQGRLTTARPQQGLGTAPNPLWAGDDRTTIPCGHKRFLPRHEFGVKHGFSGAFHGCNPWLDDLRGAGRG